jgi:hypothetical protein
VSVNHHPVENPTTSAMVYSSFGRRQQRSGLSTSSDGGGPAALTRGTGVVAYGQAFVCGMTGDP